MESEVGVFRTLVSVKSIRQFDWERYPLTRLVTDGSRYMGLFAHAETTLGLLGLVDDAGWEWLDQRQFMGEDVLELCVAPRNWVIIG